MKTYGLTHVALAVRDVKRSFKFYQQVLGIASVYEGDDSIQAQTPGTRDVLVFERSPKRAGKAAGIAHFRLSPRKTSSGLGYCQEGATRWRQGSSQRRVCAPPTVCVLHRSGWLRGRGVVRDADSLRPAGAKCFRQTDRCTRPRHSTSMSPNIPRECYWIRAALLCSGRPATNGLRGFKHRWPWSVLSPVLRSGLVVVDSYG